MRALKLTLADIHFQFKYGFYFLYLVFTVFYVVVLSFLPIEWQRPIASIMIYSDPAAIGMFFMGAIVLLEKSQRVLNSIAISPVTIIEYIFAKLISIAFISTIVGFTIAVFANINHYHYVIASVLLSSILFSLIGIIVAVQINSLNQFIIATVPFQILFTVPPVLLQLGINEVNLILHPGICAIRLIYGTESNPSILLFILVLWVILAWFICIKTVNKAFVQLGGVKL